jgi:hypothetical protein
VLRITAANDPMAFDELATEEGLRIAVVVRDVARVLRAAIDARSHRQIVRSRRFRLAGLVCAAAFVAWWGIAALARPRDIARGKQVTLSSHHAGSAAPSALVDGVLSGERVDGPRPDVVVTDREDHPWAMIDLGRTFTLREIRLYNRNDGHHDDGLPYSVETSTDGQTFATVGRRDDHFGSWIFDPPWRLRFDHAHARYVRVSATHYLALSEVMVVAW